MTEMPIETTQGFVSSGGIAGHVCFDIHAQAGSTTESKYAVQRGHAMTHLHFDGSLAIVYLLWHKQYYFHFSEEK
jgi:hypothetical protein